MSRICGCSGISPFPPASLAAPRRAGVAGLKLWPGFICRSSRVELAFILGFPLHPLLHLTEAFRAADHFIISLWSFLISHSWSGVWGWVLRWVFYFVLFCCVSVISCWVWGFLGQINLDFFFFFSSTLSLSLCPHSHHMKWSSPLHVCRIFPTASFSWWVKQIVEPCVIPGSVLGIGTEWGGN